jgi:hypothetical protein
MTLPPIEFRLSDKPSRHDRQREVMFLRQELPRSQIVPSDLALGILNRAFREMTAALHLG